MTPAEYLTARGWVCLSAAHEVEPRWRFTRENGDRMTHEEVDALEAQLAEDRAVFAFVAAHSDVTVIARRDPVPHVALPNTEDVRVVGVRCEEKTK